MQEIDKLLSNAENIELTLKKTLHKELGKRFKSEDLHSLGGELKKITGFYQRRLRAGVTNVDQEVLSLLDANVPDRGKTSAYWRTIRSVLKSSLPELRKLKLSSENILFILGWICRLLYLGEGVTKTPKGV
ncbi:MAG: hypothetical protein QXH91_01120 [Candidatus Bathyarchaeia archaeon]